MFFFLIMVVLGIGFLGFAFYINGKAHHHNDGSGGGQIMVGWFLMFLAVVAIVSQFIY